MHIYSALELRGDIMVISVLATITLTGMDLGVGKVSIFGQNFSLVID